MPGIGVDVGVNSLNTRPQNAVPALASGQTLLFAPATFANWTSSIVRDGMLTEGVDGGPTVLVNGTTRRRKVVAVEQPSPAQVTAGYGVNGYSWPLPAGRFDNGDCILLEFWLRSGPATQVFNFRPLYGLHDSLASPGNFYYGFYTSTESTTAGTYKLRFDWANATFYDSAELPMGVPVKTWMQLEFNSANGVGHVRACYQTFPNGVPGAIVQLVSRTTLPTPGGSPTLWFNPFSYQGDSPGFSGQVTQPRVYALAALADGNNGSSDYLPPIASGNLIRVQSEQIDGFTSASTIEHLINLVNKSIVMGVATTPGDYAALSTAAAKDAYGLTLYDAAPPAGMSDTVRITGTFTAEGEDWSLLRRVSGVVFTGGGELRATEPLSGASWTQPNAGTYPTVWMYTGLTRTAHPFGPLRKEWAMVEAANEAEALTRLASYPWTATVISGVLYVSKAGGSFPDERNCSIWPQILEGNVIDNLTMSGFADYDYQGATDVDRLPSTYGQWVGMGKRVSVVRNLKLYGHNRHLLRFLSPSENAGLLVVTGPETTFGGQSPRRGAKESWYSVSDGGFTAYVAFTSGVATAEAVDVIHVPYPAVSENFYAVPGSPTESGLALVPGESQLFFSHGTVHGMAKGHVRFVTADGLVPANVAFQPDPVTGLYLAYTIDATDEAGNTPTPPTPSGPDGYIASPSYCFSDAGIAPCVNGDSVYRWYHTNGTDYIEQTNALLRPTFNTNSGSYNSVDFIGSHSLTGASPIGTGTGQYLIMRLGHTVVGGEAVVLANWHALDNGSYYTYLGQIYEWFGSSARRDNIVGADGLPFWKTYEVAADNSEWNAYLEGSLIRNETSNTLPAQSTISIGNSWVGSIAGFDIRNTIPTGGDLTTLRAAYGALAS